MRFLARVLPLFGLLLAAGVLAPSAVLAQGPVAPSVVASPADAVRSFLRHTAERMVEAGRQLSPGLAERLDSLLQQRRGGAEQAPQSGARRTGEAMLHVAGVSIIGLVIALIVLVTALSPLEGVIRTVEADVSGAFWRGVLAQAITLPIVGAIMLLLALTLVGLLVVPILLFAVTLAIAGVGTLGILAVAAVIGRARGGGDARSRARLLRALLTGYGIVWAPWVAAALLVAIPGVGLGARVVALATTWVIGTVGVGAVVRSRGGRRIPDVVPVRTAVGAPAPAPDWSTPTPVTGVVAAQRPTVAQGSMD